MTEVSLLESPSLDFADDESTLVQVMARCHQAPSHYLIQCWLSSMLPYGITRPQGVKYDLSYPASIATLAQRWPKFNPYVGPTWICQLAQRWRANVGPTLCQHRPNVGTLTLGQRWHNVTPMVVCQRCTNIGPTEAALLAFCDGEPIGHRWIPLTKGQERWHWCLP